ncbi:MAG: hypothetical protein IJO93_01400, partial [Clostridia bacterium]|nr:hypothetical protein [Clostridia bacterium]
TADTKGNSQPEQQPDTELKKPTPKKTAAVAEEKPVQSQNTADNGLREENVRLQEQIARVILAYLILTYSFSRFHTLNIGVYLL